MTYILSILIILLINKIQSTNYTETNEYIKNFTLSWFHPYMQFKTLYEEVNIQSLKSDEIRIQCDYLLLDIKKRFNEFSPRTVLSSLKIGHIHSDLIQYISFISLLEIWSGNAFIYQIESIDIDNDRDNIYQDVDNQTQWNLKSIPIDRIHSDVALSFWSYIISLCTTSVGHSRLMSQFAHEFVVNLLSESSVSLEGSFNIDRKRMMINLAEKPNEFFKDDYQFFHLFPKQDDPRLNNNTSMQSYYNGIGKDLASNHFSLTRNKHYQSVIKNEGNMKELFNRIEKYEKALKKYIFYRESGKSGDGTNLYEYHKGEYWSYDNLGKFLFQEYLDIYSVANQLYEETLVILSNYVEEDGSFIYNANYILKDEYLARHIPKFPEMSDLSKKNIIQEKQPSLILQKFPSESKAIDEYTKNKLPLSNSFRYLNSYSTDDFNVKSHEYQYAFKQSRTLHVIYNKSSEDEEIESSIHSLQMNTFFEYFTDFYYTVEKQHGLLGIVQNIVEDQENDEYLSIAIDYAKYAKWLNPGYTRALNNWLSETINTHVQSFKLLSRVFSKVNRAYAQLKDIPKNEKNNPINKKENFEKLTELRNKIQSAINNHSTKFKNLMMPMQTLSYYLKNAHYNYPKLLYREDHSFTSLNLFKQVFNRHSSLRNHLARFDHFLNNIKEESQGEVSVYRFEYDTFDLFERYFLFNCYFQNSQSYFFPTFLSIEQMSHVNHVDQIPVIWGNTVKYTNTFEYYEKKEKTKYSPDETFGSNLSLLRFLFDYSQGDTASSLDKKILSKTSKIDTKFALFLEEQSQSLFSDSLYTSIRSVLHSPDNMIFYKSNLVSLLTMRPPVHRVHNIKNLYSIVDFIGYQYYKVLNIVNREMSTVELNQKDYYLTEHYPSFSQSDFLEYALNRPAEMEYIKNIQEPFKQYFIYDPLRIKFLLINILKPFIFQDFSNHKLFTTSDEIIDICESYCPINRQTGRRECILYDPVKFGQDGKYQDEIITRESEHLCREMFNFIHEKYLKNITNEHDGPKQQTIYKISQLVSLLPRTFWLAVEKAIYRLYPEEYVKLIETHKKYLIDMTHSDYSKYSKNKITKDNHLYNFILSIYDDVLFSGFSKTSPFYIELGDYEDTFGTRQIPLELSTRKRLLRSTFPISRLDLRLLLSRFQVNIEWFNNHSTDYESMKHYDNYKKNLKEAFDFHRQFKHSLTSPLNWLYTKGNESHIILSNHPSMIGDKYNDWVNKYFINNSLKELYTLLTNSMNFNKITDDGREFFLPNNHFEDGIEEIFDSKFNIQLLSMTSVSLNLLIMYKRLLNDLDNFKYYTCGYDYPLDIQYKTIDYYEDEIVEVSDDEENIINQQRNKEDNGSEIDSEVEDVDSRQKQFNKKEDIQLKQEDIQLKKADIPLKKEDIPQNKEDIPLKKADIPQNKEDIQLKKEDIPQNKEDIPLKDDDLDQSKISSQSVKLIKKKKKVTRKKKGDSKVTTSQIKIESIIPESQQSKSLLHSKSLLQSTKKESIIQEENEPIFTKKPEGRKPRKTKTISVKKTKILVDEVLDILPGTVDIDDGLFFRIIDSNVYLKNYFKNFLPIVLGGDSSLLHSHPLLVTMTPFNEIHDIEEEIVMEKGKQTKTHRALSIKDLIDFRLARQGQIFDWSQDKFNHIFKTNNEILFLHPENDIDFFFRELLSIRHNRDEYIENFITNIIHFYTADDIDLISYMTKNVDFYQVIYALSPNIFVQKVWLFTIINNILSKFEKFGILEKFSNTVKDLLLQHIFINGRNDFLLLASSVSDAEYDALLSIAQYLIPHWDMSANKRKTIRNVVQFISNMKLDEDNLFHPVNIRPMNDLISMIFGKIDDTRRFIRYDEGDEDIMSMEDGSSLYSGGFIHRHVQEKEEKSKDYIIHDKLIKQSSAMSSSRDSLTFNFPCRASNSFRDFLNILIILTIKPQIAALFAFVIKGGGRSKNEGPSEEYNRLLLLIKNGLSLVSSIETRQTYQRLFLQDFSDIYNVYGLKGDIFNEPDSIETIYSDRIGRHPYRQILNTYLPMFYLGDDLRPETPIFLTRIDMEDFEKIMVTHLPFFTVNLKNASEIVSSISGLRGHLLNAPKLFEGGIPGDKKGLLNTLLNKPRTYLKKEVFTSIFDHFLDVYLDYMSMELFSGSFIHLDQFFSRILEEYDSKSKLNGELKNIFKRMTTEKGQNVQEEITNSMMNETALNKQRRKYSKYLPGTKLFILFDPHNDKIWEAMTAAQKRVREYSQCNMSKYTFPILIGNKLLKRPITMGNFLYRPLVRNAAIYGVSVFGYLTSRPLVRKLYKVLNRSQYFPIELGPLELTDDSYFPEGISYSNIFGNLKLKDIILVGTIPSSLNVEEKYPTQFLWIQSAIMTRQMDGNFIGPLVPVDSKFWITVKSIWKGVLNVCSRVLKFSFDYFVFESIVWYFFSHMTYFGVGIALQPVIYAAKGLLEHYGQVPIDNRLVGSKTGVSHGEIARQSILRESMDVALNSPWYFYAFLMIDELFSNVVAPAYGNFLSKTAYIGGVSSVIGSIIVGAIPIIVFVILTMVMANRRAINDYL